MSGSLQQTNITKNGLEKARDIAVVLATASGAALSLYYVDRKKPALENTALLLGAAALSGISIFTLINDVL